MKDINVRFKCIERENKIKIIGPVAPSDVSRVVYKLKQKSSSGHDNISTKLMKDTIENIIEPMTHN